MEDFLTFLCFTLIIGCSADQRPPANTTLKRQEINSVNTEKANPIDDNNRFNPFYKTFFGGLTINLIQNLYQNNNTATGPMNALKIVCHPKYKDSATGIYHFYQEHEPHCDINVSIWGKGFYNNDSTQRINSVFVFNKDCKFNNRLPWPLGEIPKYYKGIVQNIDSNISKLTLDDYECLVYIQDNEIKTEFIKRFYCRNESISDKEVKWFKDITEGTIKSIEKLRTQFETEKK